MSIDFFYFYFYNNNVSIDERYCVSFWNEIAKKEESMKNSRHTANGCFRFIEYKTPIKEVDE